MRRYPVLPPDKRRRLCGLTRPPNSVRSFTHFIPIRGSNLGVLGFSRFRCFRA